MTVKNQIRSEVIYKEFNSSGIWYLPNNAIEATVEIIGGGGGGQSGRLATDSISSDAQGGLGGFGGNGVFITFPISPDMPKSLPVVVGAGGMGGAASTSTTPNNGQAGSPSSIGTFVPTERPSQESVNAAFPITYNTPYIWAAGGLGGGTTINMVSMRNSTGSSVPPVYMVGSNSPQFNRGLAASSSASSITMNTNDRVPIPYYFGIAGFPTGRIGLWNSNGHPALNDQYYSMSYSSRTVMTYSGPVGSGSTLSWVILPNVQGHAPWDTSSTAIFNGIVSDVGGGGGGSGAKWISQTHYAAGDGGYRYGYPYGTVFGASSGGITNFTYGNQLTGRMGFPVSQAGTSGSGLIPTAGTNGVNGSGGGGGGAGGRTSASNYSGASGGNGGFPGGGGGGGGGGHLTGYFGGAGGNGGNGRVRIWTTVAGVFGG